MPIDPFDVIFPWLAFSDDLFVAGMLLKLLHKYGSIPGDEQLTPVQLLTKIKAEIKKARAAKRDQKLPSSD
jgi:uncharacterized membrane protein YkvA (DUF1232 family)